MRAIAAAPSHKAPGPDGFPAELWRALPNIHILLAALFNEWLAAGFLPPTTKEGLVTLLDKKGPPLDVRNYRPITLLNSVLKLLTRVLTDRLNTVLASLVHPDQTAVKGRYIGTNIRTLSDLLTFTKTTDAPLGLLLLDQEKAFDKVSHSFLDAVLQRFGFGPIFRRWISVLYDDSQSRLRINNTIGEPFFLRRGVRQGCPPLAPPLRPLRGAPHGCHQG